MHALYGFARRADDILDDFDATLTGAERGARLQQLAAALFDQMVDGAGGGDESLAAVVTPPADTASPGSFSTTFWRRCGWI